MRETRGASVKNIHKARHGQLKLLAVAAWAALAGPAAQAFAIDTGDSDLKLNWDNTVKYSNAFRLRDADAAVYTPTQQPNVDWGDQGHKKGLISNRLDLLSEFDARYRDVGMRLSGAAWFDSEYNKSHNDYDLAVAPNTQAQAAGAPFNTVSDGAKKLMGRKAELLDAFVFGKAALGDMNLTVRAGKHTLLFGETLFLGANGIAAAQGPVDLIKAFGLPNAQFKEIAMPVGQVSSTLQINPSVSVSGYWQYEWKPMRLPASGSYFSFADFVGEGGDLLLTPGGPATRTADLKGSRRGQGGLQLKFKGGDIDYGLYAARFDDKAPQVVLNALSGTYTLMYARDIEVYGASASTVLGETNVAVEGSVRRNTPLSVPGDLIVSTLSGADNDKNTPYARGNSLHLNASAITLFGASPLWQGASLVSEVAYNRLLKVTHNPVNVANGRTALNNTHTRDALAFRLVFQPEYFQVFSGADLQLPIGLGYGLYGRSAVFQVAPEHGGDFSVGLNLDFKKIWRAGLNLTHYFGPKGPAPSLNPATDTYASYKQYYHDRDFISFNVQRTF